MEHRNSSDPNKRVGDVGGGQPVNNFGGVHNQARTQTIGGSVHHAPVYSTFVINHNGVDEGTQHGIIINGSPIHRRQQCLNSLRFPQMDARRDTIRTAHASTCQWLLQSNTFRKWLCKDILPECNGFLWIKGKPGTGKSTIVKYTMAHVQKSIGCSIISFFFNARGSALEKSTAGMYHSLLCQVLETYPDLQDVLDSYASQGANIRWTIELLQDVFRSTIQRLGTRSLTTFVDALDECEEDETRDMVSFFEQLGRSAVLSGIQFRTLFSSRHYPHITIEKSLVMILEDQPGHQEDLSEYVATELKVKHWAQVQDLKQELVAKASGIFLWLVLVIRILNREYDRGRVHTLRRRLDEIPGDLEALFHDIITRDGPPEKEMTLCVQWVLFAQRPLQLQELYFAILLGTEPEYLDSWDSSTITKDDMARFLLHASRGLVEETKSRFKATVQFIHESVRDFFLKEHRRQKLSFLGPSDTLAARSHDQLKQSCLLCCAKASVMASSQQKTDSLSSSSSEKLKVLQRLQQKDQLQRTFPFLSYSIRNVLHHSESAEQSGIFQEDFLRTFNVREWSRMNNLIHGSHFYSSDVSLLYVLAAEDLCCLLASVLKHSPTIDIPGEIHHYPLFAAQANRCWKSLRVLLSPWSVLGNDYEQYNPCVEVSHTDVEDAMEILMNADIVAKGGYTPLGWSFEHGYDTILSCLIKGGLVDMELLYRNLVSSDEPEVQTPFLEYFSPDLRIRWGSQGLRHNSVVLSWAIKKNLYGLTQLILSEKDFDINQLFYWLGETSICRRETLLHSALRNGDARMLSILLKRKDINLNKESEANQSPLQVALDGTPNFKVIRWFLRQNGVDPNKPNKYGRTVLHDAVSCGNLQLAELLLEHQVIQASPLDRHYRTPLSVANRSGHKTISQLFKARLRGSLDASATFSFGRHPSSVNGDTVDISDSLGGSYVFVNRADDADILQELDSRPVDGRGFVPISSLYDPSFPIYACDEPGCNRTGGNSFYVFDNLVTHTLWYHDKKLGWETYQAQQFK